MQSLKSPMNKTANTALIVFAFVIMLSVLIVGCSTNVASVDNSKSVVCTVSDGQREHVDGKACDILIEDGQTFEKDSRLIEDKKETTIDLDTKLDLDTNKGKAGII